MNVPESNFLEIEGVLDDAGSGHPHPQDVLLGGQIAHLRHSVYVRQVTRQNTVLYT